MTHHSYNSVMKIKIKRKNNLFVFLADEIVTVSVVTSELSGESLTLYIMYIIRTAVYGHYRRRRRSHTHAHTALFFTS